MKKFLLGLAALAVCSAPAAAVADDLATLDPQIAQVIGQALTEAAEKVEKLQVKVEGDAEKACGVHMEQVGFIIVPNKELSPENEAVNSDPGAPLAHLFMSKCFVPVVDGKPLDPAKLRTVKVVGQDGNEQEIHYITLAARHTDDDVWHLYGYGTEEKPILDVEIGEGVGPGTQPLAIEVKDLEDNNATAYVTIFDRFQCNFKVNYKPENQ